MTDTNRNTNTSTSTSTSTTTTHGAIHLLTQAEVAKVLRVTERTVYSLRERGQLRSIRVGRAIRFRPEDVRAFLESQEQ